MRGFQIPYTTWSGGPVGETGTADAQVAAAADDAHDIPPPFHERYLHDSKLGATTARLRGAILAHARRARGGRKSPPELLGEAGTANAQATDDDAPDKFDREHAILR